MKKISVLIIFVLLITLVFSSVATGSQGIRLYINEAQISLYPPPSSTFASKPVNR